MRRTAAFLTVALASLTASSAQTVTEKLLHSFAGGTDGNSPESSVIQASDGNFYGVTLYGGGKTGCGNASGCGTVYKISPSGVETVLHAFNGVTEGALPFGELTEGSDGNFYGTTFAYEALTDCATVYSTGCGTVFKITPSGTLTTLYSFTGGADGSNPAAGVIEGSDGNFYGTASVGGNLNACTKDGPGCGTIFKITPSGTFTTLHTFCAQSGCPDGEFPDGGLIQGSDGNFYGTAQQGGDNSCLATYKSGCGTVFKISSSGTFFTVYLFEGGTDGATPRRRLSEASDGGFYGVTFLLDEPTCTHDCGTIFQVTSGGTLTTLHTLCASGGCADGIVPGAIPFLGSDGTLYGTTLYGGNTQDCINATNPAIVGCGTVYSLNSSGTFSTLYTFTGGTGNGGLPSGIIQANDGQFYGTTSAYGADGDGTIYKLTLSPALAAPVQVTLSASTLAPGASATLSFEVLNAFSTTLQQCNAFVTTGGVTTALGKLNGTYNATTRLFTGSTTVTPASVGSYSYAVTCGGQESGLASLTVAKAASATTLTSTPAPVSVGQAVAIQATVTGADGAPTGTVAFNFSTTTLDTATLSAGKATYSISTNGLPPGSYPFTAAYSGSATCIASTSPAYNVVVDEAPTATTLKASPNPVTPPATLTLTATVERSAAGAVGTPTGSVTFYYSTVALASVSLNAGGVATYAIPTSSLPAGSYPLTVKYLGDASDLASTSQSVTVTVQ
jgi:uncharacterized repeat protein (TIGR03803 family)